MIIHIYEQIKAPMIGPLYNRFMYIPSPFTSTHEPHGRNHQQIYADKLEPAS